MARSLTGGRIAFAVALAVVFLIGVLPLANILSRSVLVNGAFTLENYIAAFSNPRFGFLILNSLLLAGSSALAATAAGVTIALLAVKSTIPLRGLIVCLFCMPLLFPPYILANGWFQLRLPWLFGLGGGVLVLSTAVLPLVLLLSVASLASIDPKLEEAARTCAPWPTVWKAITVPLALPGLILAAVLAFVIAMGEYGAPSFLRLKVFPVESFTQISAFYDPGAAAAAWVPMMLFAILSLSLAWKFIDSGHRYFRRFEAPPNRISFGAWSPIISAFTLLIGALVVLFPCGALLIGAISGAHPFETLSNAWSRSSDSIGWSFIYASLAATMITLLGFPLGYASQRRTVSWAGLLGPAVLILFAIPGPLAGFSIAATWNWRTTGWPYGNSAALLSAFVMQYLAVGQLGFASGLSQLPPSLEEAGQIAGAGWWRRTFTILLPLQWRTSGTVWILAFIFCLRDTSLPLLLSPPGRDTLSVRTLTLMANGADDMIAMLNLFAIIMPVIPAAIALLWLRRSQV